MSGQAPFDFNKIDPKIVALIACGTLVATAVIMGDQVAFVHPPNNPIENLLSIIPMVVYCIVGDRTQANLVAGIVYASIFAVLGVVAYRIVIYRILEPMNTKQRLQAEAREKILVNKFDKGAM